MIKEVNGVYQLTGKDRHDVEQPEWKAFSWVRFHGTKRAPAATIRDAFAEAAKVGGVLPSAQEDALFRFSQPNNISTSNEHALRTYAIFVCDQGKAKVAFDDVRVMNDNLAYGLAEEMSRIRRVPEVFVSRDDPRVFQALARAVLDERVVDIPSRPRTYDVQSYSGREGLSKDPVLKACYGPLAWIVAEELYRRRAASKLPFAVTVKTPFADQIEQNCARGRVDVCLVQLADLFGREPGLNAMGRGRASAYVNPVANPREYYPGKK